MADTAAVNQLVDHFFRHESGKLVSLLTRLFGLHQLDLVEDVVQSAMLQALETWKLQGVPRDPAGWMYRVARNKALDLVRRRNVADRLASEVVRYQAGSLDRQNAFDHLFLDREMQDSQLRMMFACCHPDLPAESQIALTLKTLCGLSTLEIARALLTTEANIKKRLARAKRKFAAQEIRFEVPTGGALKTRLASVYAVLYLLFNEGYNSSHPSELIRRDLCEEAIRLCTLLLDHPMGTDPQTPALLALMLFHAARFDARFDKDGCILLLEEQDRSRWNTERIARAAFYLSASAAGETVSRYHLEAGIAAHHSLAPSFADTDWAAILRLYDWLIRMHPSPVYALNRAIVVAQIAGPDAGIAAIEEATRLEALKHYHLLDATLGELHLRAGRPERARAHFQAAMKGTLSQAEQRLLARKLTDCETFPVHTTKEGHHANGRDHAAGVSTGSHHHTTHARAGAQ
jgi:RNA polymerase sigma factor (sigma-70 family)